MGLFKKNNKKEDKITDICFNDASTLSVELISNNELLNDYRLIEINDNDLISRINNIVPHVILAGKNVKQAINLKEPIYKVILSKGGTLTKSKEVNGAFRAFSHNGKQITENANLFKVDAKCSTQISTAAFNVASLIVGQYYISQVNKNMNLLCDEINEIKQNYDNEYLSSVEEVVSYLKEILEYKNIFLENEEVLNREIINLNFHKSKLIKLLKESINKLKSVINDDVKDFSEYEQKIMMIEKSRKYQFILINALEKLTTLDYTFNKGVKPLALCTNSLKEHIKEIKETQNILVEWHNYNIDKFKINLNASKRLKKFVSMEISEKVEKIFKKELFHVKINSNMNDIILSHLDNKVIELENNEELFEMPVEVVLKDEKYYYLLGSNE